MQRLYGRNVERRALIDPMVANDAMPGMGLLRCARMMHIIHHGAATIVVGAKNFSPLR
jgi:hypothetical protein